MKKIILERRIPLPKMTRLTKKTRKKTEILCTLNNITQWIKFQKSEIKNKYKLHISEYFIPEPDEQLEAFTVEYRIVRHTKRKIDKDNIVFGLKWLVDLMAEMGYVKDDMTVNFDSFDTIYDSTQSETMIDIRIISGGKKW